MTSAYQRVAALSVALIKNSPEGVRYLDLRKRAIKAFPDLNKNTLTGVLNRFRNNLPEGIIRPVRGFYVSEDAWKKRDKTKPVPQRGPSKD